MTVNQLMEQLVTLPANKPIRVLLEVIEPEKFIAFIDHVWFEPGDPYVEITLKDKEEAEEE